MRDLPVPCTQLARKKSAESSSSNVIEKATGQRPVGLDLYPQTLRRRVIRGALYA